MTIVFNNPVEFRDVKVGNVFQCKTGELFLKISKKSDYNAVKLTDTDIEENELLYSIGGDTICRIVNVRMVIL